MADEPKKTDKPADKPAATEDPVSVILFLLVVLMLVNGFVQMITSSPIFSRGWRGLTPEGIVAAHTVPLSSIQNPIGARVVTLHGGVKVYDSAGGTQIGTQRFNMRGKVTQGPVTVYGTTYYFVDFDSGPDGWVNENDVGYIISEPNAFERAIIFVFSLFSVARIISVIISIILLVIIIYAAIGLARLRYDERVRLYPAVAEAEPAVNPKWEKILSHVESLNENDWRLAILEADIMLADLLDKLSLPGDTIADKLKAVEKSDFTTIDLAWEAHKVRNQVAHEGSEFPLSQREARRVISLYREVFEEFEMV